MDNTKPSNFDIKTYTFTDVHMACEQKITITAVSECTDGKPVTKEFKVEPKETIDVDIAVIRKCDDDRKACISYRNGVTVGFLYVADQARMVPVFVDGDCTRDDFFGYIGRLTCDQTEFVNEIFVNADYATSSEKGMMVRIGNADIPDIEYYSLLALAETALGARLLQMSIIRN